METIGDRVRYTRLQYKLTLKEFANVLEVSTTTITNYESDKRTPDCTVLAKLQMKFHVDLNWLISGELGEKYIKFNELTLKEQRLISACRKQPANVFDKLVELLRAMNDHERNWHSKTGKYNKGLDDE